MKLFSITSLGNEKIVCLASSTSYASITITDLLFAKEKLRLVIKL